MVFRRKWGATIWHWSPHCAQWPNEIESEESESQPETGEFCNECQANEPRPGIKAG